MKIKKEIISDLYKHAEEELPLEACGYLAGKNNVVTKLYRMTNIDQSEEHFTLDPKEQLKVMKTTRNQGFEIMAVYHSHPSTPARPSIEDIKLAYDPMIHYVIVSLIDGNKAVKAFKIIDNLVSKESFDII